ncbi:MAG: TVP38/TMEM64 family protein [Clostridia bacterium]|nr:TVP38/TMEM64 family protein [Clostridia bacterium]
MENKTEFKRVKILITITVITILSIFLWQIAPLMAKLSTPEGQIVFKNKINNMGFLGILLLFGLQVVQILLVILPGEPFEVLAGMCYGAWGGYLFITISILITNIIIFFTVRKLGKKYLYNFFKKEKVEKVMNSKLFKNPRNIEFVLFIIFFMPASPKDLFVYIGGLLPVKPVRFITIATLARFPSIITSTMVGANISNGNWKTSLIIYLLSFIMAVLLIYLVNLKDKNKEFINIMK